jgi:hypothetical protein
MRKFGIALAALTIVVSAPVAAVHAEDTTVIKKDNDGDKTVIKKQDDDRSRTVIKKDDDKKVIIHKDND